MTENYYQWRVFLRLGALDPNFYQICETHFHHRFRDSSLDKKNKKCFNCFTCTVTNTNWSNLQVFKLFNRNFQNVFYAQKQKCALFFKQSYPHRYIARGRSRFFRLLDLNCNFYIWGHMINTNTKSGLTP